MSGEIISIHKAETIREPVSADVVQQILKNRVIASNWQSMRIFVHIWWEADTELNAYVDGAHVTEDMWRKLCAVHLGGNDTPGHLVNSLLDEICSWFNFETGELAPFAVQHDGCIVLPDSAENVAIPYLIIMACYRVKEVVVKKIANVNVVRIETE